MRPAVFLDRDGVINHTIVREGRPFAPTNQDEFSIIDGVPDALHTLHKAGFLLIIVTNQPDVARGVISKGVVESFHQDLLKAFPLDAIKVCYETEESGSPLYKPRPGMLLEAKEEYDIDLTKSFMVGDRWRDVGCGRAAGCFTIFIDYGYQEQLREAPDAICRGLQEAVPIILRHARA
ncbi:MAG: HAD-IIIA family hydrolase [Nitrospirota bacterium]|nr:HAD-IIIA family hydrolase [Nitrospirota bacterium]